MDIKNYKEKLEEEMKLLTEELKTVGGKDPDNPDDWVAKPEQMDTLPADSNETADAFEAYGENASILNELEIRFNEVKSALERIEGGKYGVCGVCGNKIEEDRLEANPAATTCKQHMK